MHAHSGAFSGSKNGRLEGAKINTLDYNHEFSLYPQSLQINVAKYKKYLALCQMLKGACDLHCTSMSDYSSG